MDTEHCVIAEMLALKDAPDDMLLDQGTWSVSPAAGGEDDLSWATLERSAG
jgi:hypothetical protein